MLPAHEEILSIQLVTNNKYARQVRSCAAGLNKRFLSFINVQQNKRLLKIVIQSSRYLIMTITSVSPKRAPSTLTHTQYFNNRILFQILILS